MTFHLSRRDVPTLVAALHAWQNELSQRISLLSFAAMRPHAAGVPSAVIDQAYAEDEAVARAEYGAEFRRDLESFVSKEALEAVTLDGRLELPRIPNTRYVAFVDPSGGSRDSMTIAVAHREKSCAVLDAVREVRAPFSPEAVVEEFAALLRCYFVSAVTGDRYGGEWPRERFRTHGINYDLSTHTKSDLYRDLLPLLNSGGVELLDLPRLHAQLGSLERRTARGGKDVIDHGPGGRDDVANAVAGAIGLAAQKSLAPTLQEALYAARWNATELGRPWSDSPEWTRAVAHVSADRRRSHG